jgi:hypothetical protein
MAGLVYVLCFLTALGCAIVLSVAYRRSRAALLAWSAACFAGLAVNEALVLVDVYVVPSRSFFVLRCITGLVALSLMLVGLILHSQEEGR